MDVLVGIAHPGKKDSPEHCGVGSGMPAPVTAPAAAPAVVIPGAVRVRDTGAGVAGMAPETCLKLLALSGSGEAAAFRPWGIRVRSVEDMEVAMAAEGGEPRGGGRGVIYFRGACDFVDLGMKETTNRGFGKVEARA